MLFFIKKTMATLNTNNEFSADKLLQAAAKLNSHELEKFVNQAIVLKARRNASSIAKAEAELLQKINQGLAPRLQKRFDELAEKLDLGTLTVQEHQEFLRLTNQIEKQDAKRIELLGRLAEIRQQTLDDVMQKLGIGQP